MNLSGNDVILCECGGQISGSLPMDEIRCFLEQRYPGLKVAIGDDFCQSQVLSKLVKEDALNPVVIGACSLLKNRVSSSMFGRHPRCVVNLLEEAKAPYSKAEMTERAKILLCAQIQRQTTSVVPEQALRLEFSRPSGGITRRQFFELALPQYALAPYVDMSKCIGEERCRLCQENCLAGAIKAERGKASIDQVTCQGCGVCTIVCPYNAIFYPTFSFGELDREMAGLLLASEFLEPRILALVCKNCISDRAGESHYPPNVLSLEIPCLAMASPWLVLRAFDLGAQGLALISDKCRFKLDPDYWEGNVEFARELLRKCRIDPERVKTFRGDELEKGLSQFAQEVAELEPTPLRFSSPVRYQDGELWLSALVKGMGAKLGVPLKGTVAAGKVPFGKVEVNGSRCTGCDICTLDCPTEALYSSLSEEGEYQLLFRQQSCVGCGQCVNSCPEECLSLANLLELECLSSSPMVLFQTDIARCRECGALIAPRSMLTGLKRRLSDSGEDMAYLALCFDCRAKSLFLPARR